MPKSSLSRPVFFFVLSVLTSILSLSTPSFSRPFDRQYSHFGTPFAVFYNPALIGNNPGYTLGADFKHVDNQNYDVRGALVVPVSKIITYEEHLQRQSSARFGYPNVSYRSSETALSFGGMYTSDEDIFLAAGFSAPASFINAGASIDVLNRGSSQIVSVNAALSADMLRVMEGSIFLLAFHKAIIDDDNTADFFGVSLGAGGISSSSPRMQYLPYDFTVRFNISNNGTINNIEGTARLNFDLSAVHTYGGGPGQAITGSAGVSFVRERNEPIEYKIFASLGVVFINRSSSTALAGGYGEGNEKHAALSHSTFKRAHVSSDDFSAGLEVRDINDGRFQFILETAGSANLRSWVLRIDSERGTSIKTFSGGNVIPSSILWDGLNAIGEPINDNTVNAKLVLHGERGRVIESNIVQFERGSDGKLKLLEVFQGGTRIRTGE